MRADRTMPVRRWLALLIAGLFLTPIITFGVIGFILFAPTEGPVFPAEEAIARIRGGADQWAHPAWQQQTRAWLHGEQMDAVLLVDGERIWASSDAPEFTDDRVVHVTDISATQTLVLYAPNDAGPPDALETWVVPVAVISSLVMAVTVIAWFLRRAMIEPLTATSAAAKQLAAGSYDAGIPHSRVREVNELAESFTAMRDSLHESISRQATIEEERRFLISAVAHDLRTPLFALRGSLEGILQGVAATDEKREQYLQIALRRANDLDKLISDLFAWSRLELTSMTPERAPMRLATMLRRVADGVRPQADARDIWIELAGPDVELEADSTMLHRAIENVLDNALVHSPDGATIGLTTTLEPGEVVISIRDHGAGIPEDDLERVFVPLYRGEDSRNRRTGGAGLGLGVARRIAEVHGGTVTARNHAEGGAVFEFRLPL